MCIRDSTLRGYGKVRSIVMIDVAAAILSLAVSLLLVPRYDVLGAAVAVTSTLIIHNLLNQIGLAWTTDIHLFEWRYLKVYMSIVAASLIGEIQDMEKFRGTHGLKALIAYAGLDPRIRQSRKSLNSTGRLTKRGSSHLRRSAFISANIARQHNPVLKAYYEKKRAEGKSYKVATCAVARKQLAIIRAVWLSGKPFVHHGQQDHEEKS